MIMHLSTPDYVIRSPVRKIIQSLTLEFYFSQVQRTWSIERRQKEGLERDRKLSNQWERERGRQLRLYGDLKIWIRTESYYQRRWKTQGRTFFDQISQRNSRQLKKRTRKMKLRKWEFRLEKRAVADMRSDKVLRKNPNTGVFLAHNFTGSTDGQCLKFKVTQKDNS